MLQVERAVVRALGLLALHEAVALCGGRVLYKPLLGLEVEGHPVAVVLVAPLFVHRSSVQTASLGAVRLPLGVDQAGVQIHGDAGCIQRHVEIAHLGFAIEECHARFGIVDHGVGGFVLHRRVDARLPRLHGVGPGRIGRHAVVHQRVAARQAVGHGVARSNPGSVGRENGQQRRISRRHGVSRRVRQGRRFVRQRRTGRHKACIPCHDTRRGGQETYQEGDKSHIGQKPWGDGCCHPRSSTV